MDTDVINNNRYISLFIPLNFLFVFVIYGQRYNIFSVRLSSVKFSFDFYGGAYRMLLYFFASYHLQHIIRPEVLDGQIAQVLS